MIVKTNTCVHCTSLHAQSRFTSCFFWSQWKRALLKPMLSRGTLTVLMFGGINVCLYAYNVHLDMHILYIYVHLHICIYICIIVCICGTVCMYAYVWISWYIAIRFVCRMLVNCILYRSFLFWSVCFRFTYTIACSFACFLFIVLRFAAWWQVGPLMSFDKNNESV